MKRRADISECGKYRYWLERQWSDDAPQVFIMLNPSTADAEEDDPTIRRCISFAQREGAGSISVFNLFAFRATNPKELVTAHDPIGPLNTENVGWALLASKLWERPAICAWGSHPMAKAPAENLRRRAGDFDTKLVCFGTNKDGSPKHPLHQPKDATLQPWPPEEDA